MTFEQRFQVGWSELDANAHMANRSYLDYAANVRMAYFASAGFPIETFAQMQIGPVIRREVLEYFRELRLLEEFRVGLVVAGLSEDGSRFRLRNEFLLPDDTPVAQLTSLGGWLDLKSRKLTPPPPALAKALLDLGRTEDFQVLPPRGWPG